MNAQSHAEEYYEFDRINKTMKGYYNRGLYHKAVMYPDSLEGNKYLNAASYFMFARVYSLSNEFGKTLANLEKAVKGGVSRTQIERMYDLDAFRESNMNIIFESNFDKWRKEFLLSQEEVVLDSAYIKAIRKIDGEYAANFELRKVDGDEVYFVKDSLSHYTKRESLDSIRFQSLVDLTVRKGFPTKRTIGKEFYRYSRYLRYNMPDDYDENCADWQRVKTMIFTEMEKGTVYPFYYAALEDKIRLSKKQVQVYGTMPMMYIGNNDVSNSLQFENPEELNMRRRSVGLCSIQLEMWSEARELPESLKEVEFK